MGHLLEGVWSTEEHFPTDEGGRFVRKSASFRQWVRADGSTPFVPEAGRYHLYVSYACPWAHRTLIARALLGLEDAVSVSVCHPLMLDQGWVFSEDKAEIPDTVVGIDYLHQLYTKADAGYTGRATVPVLWDKETGTIVNNESRDILRMFTTEFRALWTREVELAPTDLISAIDETAESFYQPVNNGVYRSGFARTQSAYEEAVTQLFEALDGLEQTLAERRFLVGNRLSEADICLFTTLIRFDPVYVTHFKCNLRRLVDYPNLWGFTRDVYQTPGVAQTCNMRHIKEHYFGSHESINPFRIVPIGPAVDLDEPHGRESLTL
ncbi:MAG: glutathione S-transferase family protein [Nannocystaceae bacterium]|nr:glutathione S-transferase family protein [bacterium]